MKAYVVGNKEEPEIGNEIIYAENTKEARRVAHSTDIANESDYFIDVEVHRAYEFDDTENFSKKEFIKLQWEEGWWFDEGAPDPWSSSEEDFYKWYGKTFAYLYE